MSFHPPLLDRLVMLSVTLLSLTPSISLAQDPADAPAAPIAYTDEQKFALKALDAEIARFDATLATIPDQQYRNQSKVYLDILKLRAMGIRREFDQTRYDELRFDLNAEFQRIRLWLANPVYTVPIAKAGAPGEVVLEKLKPSPADKAEVRAALDALDRQIKRLEERASLAPAGPPGEPERLRVKAIRERRSELEKNFTQARWEAMVGEVKSQLARIPH